MTIDNRRYTVTHSSVEVESYRGKKRNIKIDKETIEIDNNNRKKEKIVMDTKRKECGESYLILHKFCPIQQDYEYLHPISFRK